jgi:ubiquinone/menaquinone biosynthesis C-methylase UbiE
VTPITAATKVLPGAVAGERTGVRQLVVNSADLIACAEAAAHEPTMQDNLDRPDTHRAVIDDQFTRQADLFANAAALHNAAALDSLVRAASPKMTETSLDVACGPGTVVAAFAGHVGRAAGLDTTAAMLDQARRLGARLGLPNVAWYQGDVGALPFADGAFDIVSCRFAFHHFEQPERAFAEMLRVCRSGGRIVVCDAVASDDPARAEAFNAMERLRDPSTVAFRTLAYFFELFRKFGMPMPASSFYKVPVEMEALLKTSFPANDDRDGVRQLLRDAVEGDRMGLNLRAHGDSVRFDYPAAILVSTKA